MWVVQLQSEVCEGLVRVLLGLVACLEPLSKRPFSPVGKRRYDRKQSGYGGQTKPIFRKKVSPAPGRRT